MKNLFFRRRNKSKPPAPRDPPPQDSFQTTSSYAAVSSGPAPKVGALPLKPSQDKKPRRSFSHTKANSDALQQTGHLAQSANIGRPRTSSGSVKPFFVGVSRPADSSGIPSGPSSRGTSIDVSAIAAPALAEPPPVPPLPKDLDSFRGPRYHDIMQYAAMQQVSRATFNEHVATRNIALPRKSIDIFEAEVNQLFGERFDESGTTRNLNLPRQSIDLFEEEVALRNATLPDSQRTSFDVMRASKEGRFHQSRANSVDTSSNTTPGPSMSGPETSANTHVTRTGRGKPLRIGNEGSSSSFDAPLSGTVSRPQAGQSSRVAPRSRKHSFQENDRPGALSSIPQSRTADFMPPEWLSHGSSKAALSDESRTRSMTAAVPSLHATVDLGYANRSAPSGTSDERKSSGQTNWPAQTPHSPHGASRSLSVLEGSSTRQTLMVATRTAIRHQAAEPLADHERQSSSTSKTLTGAVARDVPQGPPNSAASPQRPPMGISTSSSVAKRVEPSGRTFMDLTNDLPDSSASNVSHPVHPELSREPQQKPVYHTNQLNQVRRMPDQSAINAPRQHTVRETRPQDALGGQGVTLRHVEAIEGHDTAAIPHYETGAAGVVPTGVLGGNEVIRYGSISPPAVVLQRNDAQPPSVLSQVAGSVASPASESRQQDQALDHIRDKSGSNASDYVYTTPESLKSNDFTDPSLAFGVIARDFALSPTRKQNYNTLKKAAQREESTSDKVAPSLRKILPAGQDKIVHHISSFTLPIKQPRSRQSSRDYIAFDEDAFQRKQEEARAAFIRLERDLQETFTFPFDHLKKTSASDVQGDFRDLSLEKEGSGAPKSRFSSVHAPTSVYQNRGNTSSARPGTTLSEQNSQRDPSVPASATTGPVSAPSVPIVFRNSRQNSRISTMSESKAEPRPASAPAPSIPLSSVSDRGRSIMSRPPTHGRMHSTASTGSSASAFSVPPHLVPERTSSIRDNEMPHFNIDDASWE